MLPKFISKNASAVRPLYVNTNASDIGGTVSIRTDAFVMNGPAEIWHNHMSN